MQLKDSVKLPIIFITAFFVRIFVNWIWQPEFSGWFNHVYYYYVQTRGLIEHSSLAYNDLPLLFFVYAGISKAIMMFGVEQTSAIIISTKLFMSIVPALIIFPVHKIARLLNGKNKLLNSNQWVLIAISGFLPFTINHMPESFQKNSLGLLVLSFIFLYALKILNRSSKKDVIIIVVLLSIIILTHFGTLGAIVLFGSSILISHLIYSNNKKQKIYSALSFIGLVFVSLSILYFLDAQRFGRIFYYLFESLQSSLLFSVFSSDIDSIDNLISLAGVFVSCCIFLFLYIIYKRNKLHLSKSEKIFWLTNIIFCFLLVLPIIDQQLMGRLSLFLYLPILVNLLFLEKYVLKKKWIRIIVFSAAIIIITFLAVGEIVSSKLHNLNNKEVYSDIQKIKEKRIFGNNDFVITKTGAEHVCNWFFNIKAGVITSLTLEDFERFDNVFVLNPIEGELNFSDLSEKPISNESEKYIYMKRNIPKPDNSETVFDSDNIEIFLLKTIPQKWRFDVNGNWRGYKSVE